MELWLVVAIFCNGTALSILILVWIGFRKGK